MKVDERTFFRIINGGGFYYRFKGSLCVDHGGSIGEAIQARVCLWDDATDCLNEIDGDDLWVRASDVSAVYDSDEDANEDAKEYYYLNESRQ